MPRRGRFGDAPVTQELGVALLLLARPPADPGHQLARRQAARASPSARRGSRTRWSRSVRARSSPGVCGPRSISTASTEISGTDEIERLVEQVAVLRGPAARSAREPDPAAAREAFERLPDGRLVELHDRVAVRRLVAREPQRVEAQRVLVRGRALLLDQRAEHPDLFCCQVTAQRQSGLSTRLQPPLVIVDTRVPQASADGSSPVIPIPCVRFETAGSPATRTPLPESPPAIIPAQMIESASQSQSVPLTPIGSLASEKPMPARGVPPVPMPTPWP